MSAPEQPSHPWSLGHSVVLAALLLGGAAGLAGVVHLLDPTAVFAYGSENERDALGIGLFTLYSVIEAGQFARRRIGKERLRLALIMTTGLGALVGVGLGQVIGFVAAGAGLGALLLVLRSGTSWLGEGVAATGTLRWAYIGLAVLGGSFFCLSLTVTVAVDMFSAPEPERLPYTDLDALQADPLPLAYDGDVVTAARYHLSYMPQLRPVLPAALGDHTGTAEVILEPDWEPVFAVAVRYPSLGELNTAWENQIARQPGPYMPDDNTAQLIYEDRTEWLRRLPYGEYGYILHAIAPAGEVLERVPNVFDQVEPYTPPRATWETPIYWEVDYYNNPYLLENPVGPPSPIRGDNALSFDWGAGGPGSGVSAVRVDNFSARWTANPVFSGGAYRFTASADDEIRVIVDGEALIDTFDQGEPAGVQSAVALLDEGPHRVEVLYREYTGDARLRVTWEDASQPPPAGDAAP